LSRRKKCSDHTSTDQAMCDRKRHAGANYTSKT
jgi:hypothetical protein